MGDVLASIDGVLLTPLRRIAVAGGDVLHALKRDDPGFSGFGEAYFSTVQPGAIKGWKRHRRMRMNLVVPQGKVAFLVHDAREGSATCGARMRVVLGPDSAETYQRLTVAADLWMAFASVGPGPGLVLNLADLTHDPDEAESRPLDAFDTGPLRALV